MGMKHYSRWQSPTYGDSPGGSHFKLVQDDEARITKLTIYKGQMKEGYVLTGFEVEWENGNSEFVGGRGDSSGVIEFEKGDYVGRFTIFSGYFVDGIDIWYGKEGENKKNAAYGGSGGGGHLLDGFYKGTLIGLEGNAGDAVDRLSLIFLDVDIFED